MKKIPFTIPSTALAGTTRMRVKQLFGTTNIENPCLGSGFGQFEDYSLNVTLCTPSTWYADSDGDTYGNPSVSLTQCLQPVGYVLNNTDCNDSVAAINPGMTEILYDGFDNNCNGLLDEGNQLIANMTNCGTTLATIGSLIGCVSTAGVDG